MIKNNLLLAFRLFSRKKAFSFVVVLGLSISIGAAILVVDYAQFELSYDKFFDKYDRIYRIQHNRFANKEIVTQKALSLPEVGIAMKDYFPEIEQSTRLFPVSTNIEPVFTSTGPSGELRSFSEPNVYAADSNFCKVFNIEFIYGNKETSLNGSNNVIISHSTAQRYFGKADVIGEVLRGKDGDLTITGVFKDLPANTHLKFDMLWSWFQMYGERSRFTYDGFYNYVLLKQDADINALKQRTAAFSDAYMRDYYKERPGGHSKFHLQSLSGIHLDSRLDGEMTPAGNRNVVNIILIVAALMIVIAVINHVNLNTSRSLTRVKEMVVRKTIGSSRMQLSMLFLTEALMLCVISTAIGLLLAFSFYPSFNILFNSQISLQIFKEVYFWIASFLFISIASIVSGFYPAFMLNSFKIQEAIKGSSISGGKSWFQRALVTSQFAISLLLVISTYALFQQVTFMQATDLGFEAQQKLVVKLLPSHGEEGDSVFNMNLSSMQSELSNKLLSKSATVSSSIPGRINEWRGTAGLSGRGEQSIIRTTLTRVDEEFLDTFGLTLIAGRNFSATTNKQQTIIVNEEAAKAYGFKNPEEALGVIVDLMGKREIIGVVRSFHETGLKDQVVPSMFIAGAGYMKFMTISLTTGKIEQKLSSTEQIWRTHFPNKPFEYFFLDDYFNRQYQSDVIVGRGIGLFSAIAIVIACLGLFSLSIHAVHSKTKEIGIKKVLGASVSLITRQLCGNFLIPVLLSAIIALPVSYYVVGRWLEQYTYRMEITAALFVIPSLAMFAIGTSTVLHQSVRAARRNPTESLKSE
jgi:putative ABC transport system permease protein